MALAACATVLAAGGMPLVLSDNGSTASRFYAARSPFNQPIGANPTIAPNSQELIAGLSQLELQGGFVLAVKRYTVPVYVASRTTPRYRVMLTASWAPHRWLTGVPIPAQAAPDPSGDAHLAIVDPHTRCEYDFWQMHRTPSGWTAAWGNSLRTNGPGVFRYGLSARASGFGLLAGLILPQELARRGIRHALVFSYPHTSAQGFVPPATESDGTTTSSDAIPEGARLQLDPAFDVSSLPGYEQTIARALQQYGMYLADTGEANVSLYAANPQSYRRNPYASTLPDEDYVGLQGIPLDRFRVLAYGHVRLGANRHLVRTGCARYA